MGAYGTVIMVKLSETEDLVTYEFWVDVEDEDEYQRGVLQYSKLKDSYVVINEAEYDPKGASRRAISKLSGFRRKGLDFPNRTCWAG